MKYQSSPGRQYCKGFIERNVIQMGWKSDLGTEVEKYVLPQMVDTRPDLRQRALFATSSAACRWNKMLLVVLNVDIPRAAIAVATEHRAQWASGCHPPRVASGTGNNSQLHASSGFWYHSCIH